MKRRSHCPLLRLVDTNSNRSRPVDPAMSTRYTLNSLKVDSEEMDQIKKAAKQHSICVVLGFSERTESNSLYISQAIISPQGQLIMKRRKLKPTHMVCSSTQPFIPPPLNSSRNAPSSVTALAPISPTSCPSTSAKASAR